MSDNSLVMVGLMSNNQYHEWGLDNNISTKSALFAIDTDNNHEIIDIFCGDLYTIYYDKNEDYWCQGRGDTGFNNETHSIAKLTKITYFQSKRKPIVIKKISAGYSACLISNKNRLYIHKPQHSFSCKDAWFAQGEDHVPKLVNSLYNVIDASATSGYSIAICTINIDYILAFWIRCNSINVPENIITFMKTVYGNTNQVYSISSGYPGNGHEHDNSQIGCKSWKKIETLKYKQIIKVSTGNQHSLFVADNGSVWACGDNDRNQLGLNKTYDGDPTEFLPLQIPYFGVNKIQIKTVKCGAHHNLAIDYNDKLYAWGDNKYGQCGACSAKKPELIFKDDCIKAFDCGGYHSYVGTKDDKHYLFGRNDCYQCLDKSSTNNVNLRLINHQIKDATNGKTIKAAALGNRCTILLVGHFSPDKTSVSRPKSVEM